MCNYLHEHSRPIKTTGYGWKIFTNDASMTGRPYRKNLNNQYIEWSENRRRHAGFCFCLTKKEALRLARVWVKRSVFIQVVVARIHYKGGLGRHAEDNICRGYYFDTALCTNFKRLTDPAPVTIGRKEPKNASIT